ncbi:kinase-like domain-containing protein, partial [Mycena albidolilacea]
NILVKGDWSACLTDFGLSIFSDATSTTSTNQGGSLYWMAPELLDPSQFGLNFARTPATDVYAFGCVCFELYTGRPPFSSLREPGAMNKILNNERPQRPSGPSAMSYTLATCIRILGRKSHFEAFNSVRGAENGLADSSTHRISPSKHACALCAVYPS